MGRFYFTKKNEKKRIKVINILLFTAFFLVILPLSAMTKDFPTKPINLLHPYSAGGPSGIVAKSLAEIAEKFLGQPIVVLYKPGGGGIIAPSIVSKEKPDGYTIAVTGFAALVQVPQMREVGFDPLNDFEFIIEHMTNAGAIICRADKPWKSMKELVAYSKQHPEIVTVGVPGIGGASHVGVESVAKKEGVRWKIVPFVGSPQIITAVAGGHIDLGVFGDVVSWKGFVKTGELKILAIEGMAKGEDFPEATTFEELGYGTTVGASFGIVAPKGTPTDVIKKLHDAFKRGMEDPEYEATCKKVGVFNTYSSSEDFLRKLKKEYENRGKILKDLGLIKK